LKLFPGVTRRHFDRQKGLAKCFFLITMLPIPKTLNTNSNYILNYD
jgi:hypothetical protein